MPRKIVEKSDDSRYGILVSYEDNTSGWITGEGGKILLWPSVSEAERALKKLKASGKYSWNCTVCVSEYQSEKKQ